MLLKNKFFELLLIFVILFGVCFAAYSNGLHNGFMWDDGPTFSDIKLKNIKYLPNAFLFSTSHSVNTDSFINSNAYYRPMAYIITLLSYLCFGDSPFGYHALNLFIFSLMCFTVFIFIDLFFKNRMLAVITSLLFAAHPINVFFVDYITSPIHSVRFICMFLSVIFFLKALGNTHKFIYYPLSFFSFITALLCHETSIVLPFYIAFTAFYFKKKNIKQAIFTSWPYWFILLLYLIFRFQCTGLRPTLPAAHVNPLIYLATFSKIIFLYVSKLFCPQGIVFFWNSPWMTGLNACVWIAGLFAVLGGWWLMARAKSKDIGFFCASWLLIGFIPVFLAAFPPYDKIYYGLIIEPQWVTFASVGFFLYTASIGLKLYARWQKILTLVFISILILLMILVRRSNEIWGDDYRYYFYWSQQITPLPPVNYAYLADIYARKNDLKQTRYYTIKALGKKPSADGFYNLGVIDMRLGNTNAAKKEFLLSVKYDPNYSSAYNNLGVIYFNQKDYSSAKEAFLRTIQIDKYCVEARSNLGLISLMQGDYKEAVLFYSKNLEIVPNDMDSVRGLVQAYTALNDPENRDKYARLLGKVPN
jgi:hypothetical protein